MESLAKSILSIMKGAIKKKKMETNFVFDCHSGISDLFLVVKDVERNY